MNRQLYQSLSPENREAIDRARAGRELGRLTIEDAVAQLTGPEAVQQVRMAFFKAYPKERAQELLSMMGDP